MNPKAVCMLLYHNPLKPAELAETGPADDRLGLAEAAFVLTSAGGIVGLKRAGLTGSGRGLANSTQIQALVFLSC